eukprot:TRINITY_DN33287_c0_g1_i1.p1 TRINITY_DN33287_c0_g1~~TRINITY_DN33287_c0_g1_i1.p1  ORF type:complete len:228 (-),score=52.94 TRINITY_DN33287_c0_g1_i1:81-764(-)
MGYLSDEKAAELYAKAQTLPEVAEAVQSYKEAWRAAGLEDSNLSADEFGPIFAPEADPPLLSDSERVRAADPERWQLVHMTDIGLAVTTFDDKESAEKMLRGFKRPSNDDGGGILFKGGNAIEEKLFLKFMMKEDYVDFLKRAIEPPPPAVEVGEEELLQLASENMIERYSEMARLAPEISSLKSEYESRGLTKPELVYGKPTPALVEFARLFPQFVTLGGCCVPMR